MIGRIELIRALRYDPSTGAFTWRTPPRGARVGQTAGNIQNGRRKLCINRKKIFAGRAAWIYVYGDIPDGALIDHIDGDTLNDRIINLRLAGTTQNIWNSKQRAGRKYALGVSRADRGRFKARIQLPNGKKLNLGTWATEAEAHAAYMGAAAVLHGEFWIGNRPASGVSVENDGNDS